MSASDGPVRAGYAGDPTSVDGALSSSQGSAAAEGMSHTATMPAVAPPPSPAPVWDAGSTVPVARPLAPADSGPVGPDGLHSAGVRPADRLKRSGRKEGAAVKPPAPARRRARLTVTRVDPWSVFKLSLLLAIALGIVTVVAIVLLWNVLDTMGVFTSVSSTYQELTATDQKAGFDLQQYFAFNRVLGVASVLAVVNVILITALATLSAFLYNITTALVGGLHITLTDDVG